jgi:hypothetical protein
MRAMRAPLAEDGPWTHRIVAGFVAVLGLALIAGSLWSLRHGGSGPVFLAHAVAGLLMVGAAALLAAGKRGAAIVYGVGAALSMGVQLAVLFGLLAALDPPTVLGGAEHLGSRLAGDLFELWVTVLGGIGFWFLRRRGRRMP